VLDKFNPSSEIELAFPDGWPLAPQATTRLLSTILEQGRVVVIVFSGPLVLLTALLSLGQPKSCDVLIGNPLYACFQIWTIS